MDINNDTLDAIWVVNSETSEELLLDQKTGQVLARKDHAGKIVYDRPN